MRFDPQLAEIRFGCGLSPNVAPPVSVDQMLATLTRPDAIAARFPIEGFDEFGHRIGNALELQKVRRTNRGSVGALAAKKAIRLVKKDARIAQATWFCQHLNRWVSTDAPFRERLTMFWADHFTTMGKAGVIRRAVSPYIESAIRPHINDSFETLLQAAVLHPMMIHYLDQIRSIGPNSKRAIGAGKSAGLNENLARELLELHTLGVHAAYDQTDVTQLAELLTGVTYGQPVTLKFRKDLAEPGPEVVLGKTYGGGEAGMRDVQAVLRDLARHPATAAHIAHKMAVHFTSDTPDPALVAALEAAFLETDGDLAAVNSTLLNHPSAWDPVQRNVKQPFQFMASALRALAPPPAAISGIDERDVRKIFYKPLSEMGQVWEKPAGPDGLPEEDSAWIAPQGIAARLQWAISVPNQLIADLPDPRQFVQTALGDFTTPAVNFAADAAESRWDGVGLILASPAFQRT
ncbi:DUF1800 domain-containing protein [uncultured Sulfitobacter sp.]|uniref:DUF1800 domain-containing protein n=1 Tax=uncultured Sulfitobacter sp. TaxID=191468 RepID=UPI00262E9182|nr:DUF1800 domain-containing protein [uncultured Sulfitobacter sp.]